MLGADVKFEKFDDIHEKVYRVSDIKNGSPADISGFTDN